MYSRTPRSVNVTVALAILALCGASLAGAQGAATGSARSCDPALARLFSPLRPRLGRYEVCASAEPLTALAQAGWSIEALPPLDAFGTAGAYDRARVARLYGGKRAQVARGWRRSQEGFESITLVSPYPDPTLNRLEPGTLIIRFILCCT